MALGRACQALGDLVECLIPRDRPEGVAARTLLADPAQRPGEAIRVMLALAIAGDLGADDTPCIGLRRRPPDPPDTAPADALDRERAGARAIVRADTGDDVERHGSPAS